MNDFSQRVANLTPEKRALLEAHLKTQTRARLATIPRLPRSGKAESFTVSFAQQRLWFLDQWESGSSLYNISVALRLRGPLNAAVLERCVREIVARHESLRTTFSTVDEQPVQWIHSADSWTLRNIDLSALTPHEREAEAGRLATADAQLSFDLARGPLIRVTLLRLDDDDHALLTTIHHIISDMWSLRIFFREIEALYHACQRGHAPPLAELPIQYADYSVWQRQWLSGVELDKQIGYWKEKLAGSPALLELPADRPRPAAQTFNGARSSSVLSKTLLDGLNVLSQREGCTLFMTLLAAYQILLARHARSDDIVVGSPIAGRTRGETEGLIGFFVNTLVLRGDLSGNPSFRELLARVRETSLGAFAHQDLPFEKLVEELKPARSMSYSPLFQVMFSLHEATEGRRLNLEGLFVTPLKAARETAKFDFTLNAIAGKKTLNLAAEYNTDLFDESTVARMLDHFHVLLQGIVANPDCRLSDLPLLTPAERDQLLVQWNQTRADYPQSCAHLLFEEQARKTPDQIALVRGAAELCFSELDERANQLAHHLRALGVGPDVLVAVYVERSLDMMIGLLGVWKAGGAYVPLDPAYPSERIGFMLDDAAAPVVLTQQSLASSLPEHSAKLVCLDLDWSEIAQQPRERPAERKADAGNLAYVIYTSGSTGKPKGVCVPHSALINMLLAMREQTAITSGDRLLAVTTLSFDIAALELFLPLVSGARTVLAGREDASDGEALIARIEQSGATIMQATPATWRLLLESGWNGNPRLRILCGGEALSRDLAEQLLTRCASLTNLYGPTETTVWSAAHRVSKDATHSARAIPIGLPIANTQIHVLDTHLNPVPIGVAGELHIGGAGLARGYLRRPELTTEKFIPNPFSSEANARLYKTGDLARVWPDGNIECLGRLDHQVKIRGYRIELGEIEAVLGDHPAVREQVVVAREDSPGDRRLVAYVAASADAQTGSTGLIEELRGVLRGKLPDYMMPAAFVVLDAMPLTPNGKIDRRALPAPDRSRSDDDSFAAPSTPNEEALAAIWAEVLKLERVGIHDNFFELGGHSLLATQVIWRVRKNLGVDASLRDLFEQPTVAGFTQAITRRQMNAVDPEELMKMLAELENASDQTEAQARASSH